MNLSQMIDELIAQRDKLSTAIAVLQGLASQSGEKRRGRPPKWIKTQLASVPAFGAEPENKGRKAFSAATRRRMAMAQKKRWKALKKAAKHVQA